MHKSIYINDIIGFDVPDKIFPSLENLKKDDTLTIYITSHGGFIDPAFVLIEEINSLIEKGVKVKVVGVGIIASAAFLLFFLINSKDKIIYNALGLTHAVSGTIPYRNMLEKNDFYKEYVKNIKYINQKIYNYLEKLGLPKNELNMYKNGKDNYIAETQLKRLLKNNIELIKKGENHLSV